jgi:glycosyltransferase involved in cell wall biosynthesis
MWYAFIAPKQYHWPDDLVAPIRSYFLKLTSTSTDGFRLSRAALTIWELRSDLQRTFSLADRLSVWRYLRWLLVDGLRELGLTIDEFDPRLRSFLVSPSPRFPGISQLLEMLHDYRADLKGLFDLHDAEKRQELIAWADQHILLATHAMSLGEALRDPSPPPTAAPVIHRATVALTGYWAASTGRGEDVRGTALGLDAVGYSDYVVIDLETLSTMRPGGEPLPPGTAIEVDVNIVHTNADTAAEDAATLRRLGVSSRKSIGFWAWELEWLPDYWRFAYVYYDEIWASTRFAEAAFNVDGVRPVKLVPMVVTEPQIDLEVSRADLGIPADVTLFLFIFDYRSFASRKNPEAVVRAFLKAFPAGCERVYLVIKTSGATAMQADAAVLRALADDPRIELRDARLERTQLLNLIRTADAFVSLHRAEGFGRGPAEAMLLGVTTIVTDYSGSADYATSDNALLVDYQLTLVAEGDYPGVTGQRWAEANINTAARHMRWVYENRAEARALGRRGRERIQRLYNARTVGEAILDALGDLAPIISSVSIGGEGLVAIEDSRVYRNES